jgi:hypothetical protein
MPAMEKYIFQRAYTLPLFVLWEFLLLRNFLFDYHNPMWAAIDGVALIGGVVAYFFKSKRSSNS